MNLREEILKEHSKAQCTKIVNWVGTNQQRFDEVGTHRTEGKNQNYDWAKLSF